MVNPLSSAGMFTQTNKGSYTTKLHGIKGRLSAFQSTIYRKEFIKNTGNHIAFHFNHRYNGSVANSCSINIAITAVK